MFGFSGVSYKLNYSINLFRDLNLLEIGERKNLTDTQYLNFTTLKLHIEERAVL